MKKTFCLLTIIICSAILWQYLPKVTHDSSISQLFVKESRVYRNFTKFHNIFGTDEFLVLAVSTKSKDILQHTSLNMIKQLTTYFEKDKHIDMVVSITNIKDFAVKKISIPFFDDKYVPYPVGDLLPNFDEIDGQIRQRIFSDPFFYTGLISQDRKTSFIWLLLKPQLKESRNFAQYIENLQQHIPPQVRISGFPLIYITMKQLVMRDAQTLFIVSFVLSVILLIVCKVPRRAIVGFFMSLLVTSSLWILFIYFSDHGFHIFSNIVPLFFFITSVPVIIHMNHTTAPLRTITRRACLWSTVTTAVGLFTLYFSNIQPVAFLGLEIPLVMLSSFAVNICFCTLQQTSSLRPFSPNNNKKMTLVVAAILSFPWILVVTPPQVLPSFIDYLPKDHKVVSDFQYISQQLKAQHPFEIMIEFNNKKTLLAVETYLHLQDLEREMKTSSREIIAEIISPATLMASLNWKFAYDTQQNIDAKNFHVAAKTTQFAISWLVQPFFLFFEGNTGEKKGQDILSYYRSQMQQLFSTDGKYTRIGCRLRSDDPQKILALERSLQPILDKYATKLNAKMYCTGYSLLLANTAVNIYQTQYTSILWGSLFIAILFLLIMRSLRLTILAIFINAMSLLGLASVFVVCGFDITLYTVILLAGLIGIMVDDTIHFMVHYNYYCKYEENFDNRVAKTLQQVKPAIVSSSLILVSGFSVFFMSQLSVYHSFAFIFQAGIVLALFWDCYALPIFMYMLYKKQEFYMESNADKIKVIGISGSMRANSYTSAAIKIALEGAKEFGAEVELIELSNYSLVFCNAENEENYPPDVEKLRQKVAAAHGIIIGTPEYHGGYSGILKNALDLMGFREFEGKMMGLVGVAGGKMGAINALNGLRVVGRTLHSWVIPQQASISESWKKFDENGNLLDKDLLKQVRSVGQQIAKFSYLHHSNQAMEFLRLWESSIENPGAK